MFSDHVEERIPIRELTVTVDHNDTITIAIKSNTDIGPDLDHFCLRVDPFDVDAIASHLASFGIECPEPQNRYGARGLGPSLYIADPDGNTVELKGLVGEPLSTTDP